MGERVVIPDEVGLKLIKKLGRNLRIVSERQFKIMEILLKDSLERGKKDVWEPDGFSALLPKKLKSERINICGGW